MSKNEAYTELQLRHQREIKDKREAIKRRKARTHRLIVRGAIVESLIEKSEDMTDEQFRQELLQRLIKEHDAPSHPQDSSGSFPQKSLSKDPAEQPPAGRTITLYRDV